MLWKHQPTPEAIRQMNESCMIGHLGIELVEIGEDYITARMPVDRRTTQPFGLLHGGASAALAESLGSMAATYCLEDPMKQAAVGVEINCSHLRSASSGYVTGTVKPYRIGRKMQVWNIEIVDEAGKLVCVSRLTIAVVDRA